MKHVMRHELSAELAKKAAIKAFESYGAKYAKYNPVLNWLDDDRATASFSAKGVTLSGEIALKPGAIELDFAVPLVLRMFKKRAVDVMERELRLWVDKAQAGELD